MFVEGVCHSVYVFLHVRHVILFPRVLRVWVVWLWLGPPAQEVPISAAWQTLRPRASSVAPCKLQNRPDQHPQARRGTANQKQAPFQATPLTPISPAIQLWSRLKCWGLQWGWSLDPTTQWEDFPPRLHRLSQSATYTSQSELILQLSPTSHPKAGLQTQTSHTQPRGEGCGESMSIIHWVVRRAYQTKWPALLFPLLSSLIFCFFTSSFSGSLTTFLSRMTHLCVWDCISGCVNASRVSQYFSHCSTPLLSVLLLRRKDDCRRPDTSPTSLCVKICAVDPCHLYAHFNSVCCDFWNTEEEAEGLFSACEPIHPPQSNRRRSTEPWPVMQKPSNSQDQGKRGQWHNSKSSWMYT